MYKSSCKPHILTSFLIFVNLLGINMYLTVALTCIFLITRENEQLFSYYWLCWYSSSVLLLRIFANFDLFIVNNEFEHLVLVLL